MACYALKEDSPRMPEVILNSLDRQEQTSVNEVWMNGRPKNGSRGITLQVAISLMWYVRRNWRLGERKEKADYFQDTL